MGESQEVRREPHVKGASFFLRFFPTTVLQIGPLQLDIHVVQNRHVGEQKSHWDKTNKGNYYLKLCLPFVCPVAVRRLLSSMAVLFHVNG